MLWIAECEFSMNSILYYLLFTRSIRIGFITWKMYPSLDTISKTNSFEESKSNIYLYLFIFFLSSFRLPLWHYKTILWFNSSRLFSAWRIHFAPNLFWWNLPPHDHITLNLFYGTQYEKIKFVIEMMIFVSTCLYICFQFFFFFISLARLCLSAKIYIKQFNRG